MYKVIAVLKVFSPIVVDDCWSGTSVFCAAILELLFVEANTTSDSGKSGASELNELTLLNSESLPHTAIWVILWIWDRAFSPSS